ncbi:MAG: phosphoglucosamine mutase [bacterium]|jgi:phosphoglucosamine mutase
MGKLFGTDGVRGVANRELTPELAYRLGRTGAYVLTNGKRKARIVVGRDTRISGQMLEKALIAGMLSVGADVYQVGIIPTPGIAYLTCNLQVDAGVVISASHNPVEDNGIKFFSADGYKLPDEVEEQIETLLAQTDSLPRPIGSEVGQLHPVADAVARYVDYLAGLTPVRFNGLRLVLDCANGAAYQVAPELWRRLGADVIPLFNEPNGFNINVECGSTCLASLQKAVVRHKAHLGLAFDGDADRVLAVDETGQPVDGDQIMCISALHLAATGKLAQHTMVTTIMSNLGLELALDKKGIKVVRTQVGDRYVLAKMQQLGAVLGGEQSGHIIFLEHNTTGDGLVTGLKLVTILQESGKSLSELVAVMPQLPQVQRSVRVNRKDAFATNAQVQKAIKEAEASFTGVGRVVVRPSGTEPKVRVMVEGENEAELEEIAGRLLRIIAEELG